MNVAFLTLANAVGVRNIEMHSEVSRDCSGAEMIKCWGPIALLGDVDYNMGYFDHPWVTLISVSQARLCCEMRHGT